MKNRTLLVFASVMVALLLLTGACSAGFTVGSLFQSRSTVTLPEPGISDQIAEPEQNQASSQENSQSSSSGASGDSTAMTGENATSVPALYDGPRAEVRHRRLSGLTVIQR